MRLIAILSLALACLPLAGCGTPEPDHLSDAHAADDGHGHEAPPPMCSTTSGSACADEHSSSWISSDESL